MFQLVSISVLNSLLHTYVPWAVYHSAHGIWQKVGPSLKPERGGDWGDSRTWPCLRLFRATSLNRIGIAASRVGPGTSKGVWELQGAVRRFGRKGRRVSEDRISSQITVVRCAISPLAESRKEIFTEEMLTARGRCSKLLGLCSKLGASYT